MKYIEIIEQIGTIVYCYNKKGDYRVAFSIFIDLDGS